jgi:hypothetical protein
MMMGSDEPDGPGQQQRPTGLHHVVDYGDGASLRCPLGATAFCSAVTAYQLLSDAERERGAASVASLLAAVLTEIYLCNVCFCHEILRRNGHGQRTAPW